MAINIKDQLNAIKNQTNFGETEGTASGTPTDDPAKNFPSLNVQAEDFGSSYRSKFTTSQRLAEKINSMFAPVFRDYTGCIVLTNDMVPALMSHAMGTPPGFAPPVTIPVMASNPNGGNLSVVAYFSEKPNGVGDSSKVANLFRIADMAKQTDDLVARINRVMCVNSNRKYELTLETKQLLSKYVSDSYLANRNDRTSVRWNDISYELSENNGYMQMSYRICVAVRLDLLKIIKEIYKTKIDGHFIDYAINVMRPLGQTNPMMASAVTNNYLLNITQLDTKELEDLCKEIGVIGGQTNIPMIRV